MAALRFHIKWNLRGTAECCWGHLKTTDTFTVNISGKVRLMFFIVSSYFNIYGIIQ